MSIVYTLFSKRLPFPAPLASSQPENLNILSENNLGNGLLPKRFSIVFSIPGQFSAWDSLWGHCQALAVPRNRNVLTAGNDDVGSLQRP